MRFVFGYEQTISWIVAHSGGSDKFAHTYAGLAIWLLSALTLGRSTSSGLPLAMVILAEVANECIDRISHGSWRLPDTLGDMAATWCWPVLLTALFRWAPGLFASRIHPRRIRRDAHPAPDRCSPPTTRWRKVP